MGGGGGVVDCITILQHATLVLILGIYGDYMTLRLCREAIGEFVKG